MVVLDAGEPGAWHVAAGMLAPVSEAEFGERAQLALGLESARRYQAFVDELDDAGYRAVGTLVVARDRDEAEALDRLAAFRHDLGLPVERLRPSQARRLEPALAPTIRLALDIESDHSIDPRKLVAALARKITPRRGAGDAGCAWRASASAASSSTMACEIARRRGRRRRGSRCRPSRRCPSTRGCRSGR